MSYIREKWEEAYDQNIAPEPVLEENKAWLEGEVVEGFELNHSTHEIKMYTAKMEVERTSGFVDNIYIIASDKVMSKFEQHDMRGKRIQVGGKVISRRSKSEGKHHLSMLVMAEFILVEPLKKCPNTNMIYLLGTIQKAPIYRITPLGRRISEFMLRVEKGYGHFAYIHCIAWGDYARFSQSLAIGNTIELFGRMQSRSYWKDGETREVNEISAFMIGLAE